MSYQKFYSNQIHSSSLLCHLSQMWKDQILCDALIRTGPITTKAHRLVLIAACPMLQSMENAAAGSHLEVRLAADIKQDAVNTFLQYLYEGFMMLTEDNCRDVEKVARLLQVDGVIKCCSDFYKCYQSKTGIVMQHGGQHKYSFQDLVEFRHVRSSDIIKSANERLMKRTSEFSRPGSPGGKRQRMHHAGSPHTEGPSFRSSAEDVVSMTDSYRSHHPDIWERVPRTGAAKGGSGRSLQPGVIDIVEDSIEIVQTDTIEKDPSRPLDQQRQTGQRSVAISIASQITDNNDLRIVNITGSGGTKDGTGSRTNMSATSTTSSSRGQTSSLSSQHLSESFQHSSPQSISSPSSSQSSLPRTTDRVPSLARQQELQQRAQDYLPNLGSDIELVPVSKPIPRLSQEGPQSSSGPSPRQQPFPVSLSPVGYPSQASVPPKPFSAGSFPTAAAGSANQVMGSPHSVPSPGARGPRSQSLGSQGRSDSTERISPANEGGKEQSLKDKGESSCSSTADMTPDLSIVKIEKTPGVKDEDTGGLDMYVDMADNSTMVLQAPTGDDDGEKSDEEHDEALEEWAREEMANEGSNISGEHGAMPGSFKDQELFMCWGSDRIVPSKAEQPIPPYRRNVYESCGMPKPGIVDPVFASKFKMVELVPGSLVYVYPEHINRVLKVGIEEGYEERSGEKMGRYLLGIFWSNQELIGATLSQKNPDRKILDPVIIEAIIWLCFTDADFQSEVQVSRGNVPEEIFQCELCGKGFDSKTNLSQHVKFQCRDFRCKLCPLTFIDLGILKLHMSTIHNQTIAVVCDDCGKMFKSKSGLYFHRNMQHNVDKKVLKCETCGLCCASKSRLLAHEKTHSGEMFVCKRCGKEYKAERSMKRHRAYCEGLIDKTSFD